MIRELSTNRRSSPPVAVLDEAGLPPCAAFRFARDENLGPTTPQPAQPLAHLLVGYVARRSTPPRPAGEAGIQRIEEIVYEVKIRQRDS